MSVSFTGDVGRRHRRRTGSVSAVALRVSEALAAVALDWAFWSHVRLHRHSQAAEFGEWSLFWHLRPSRHWYNDVWGAWEGGPWRGPGRVGRNATALLPGYEYSGIPASLWRRSQAYPYPGSSQKSRTDVIWERCRCGNSHRLTHRGTAAHWQRLWTLRRLMGRLSTSRPLVGPSDRKGRMPATRPRRNGYH